MSAIKDSIVPSLGDGFNSIKWKQTSNSALQHKEIESLRINCKESTMTQALIVNSSHSRTHISMNMKATVPTNFVKVAVHSGLETDRSYLNEDSIVVLYFYEREYIYKYKQNEAFISSEASIYLVDTRRSLSSFHTTYGDSYISEIGYGRELNITIRFKNKSQFKKTILDAGLKLHDLAEANTVLSFFSELSKLDIHINMVARGYKKTPEMKSIAELSSILDQLNKGEKGDPVPLYFTKTPYSEIALINPVKLTSVKDKEIQKIEEEIRKKGTDRIEKCTRIEDRVNRACNILDTILEAKKMSIQRLRVLTECDFSSKLRESERKIWKEKCDFLRSCHTNLVNIQQAIEKNIFDIGVYLADLKAIIQYLNEATLADHFNNVLIFQATKDEIENITKDSFLRYEIPEELAMGKKFKLITDGDLEFQYLYKGIKKLIPEDLRDGDVPKEKVEKLRLCKKKKEDPLPNKLEIYVEIPLEEENLTSKILGNLQEEAGSPTERTSQPFVPEKPSWRKFS